MIELGDPLEAKQYLKAMIADMLGESFDAEESFYFSFEHLATSKPKGERVVTMLAVEGEPNYQPGASAKNQMLVQMAVLDLVSKKGDILGQEQAKASTYRFCWLLLQSIFQDYSDRQIPFFKFENSRILPLEAKELPDYYGSLLTFRITGLAPTSDTFYNP
jgi:hypothetical protein